MVCNKVYLKAPAKINLYLHIIGKNNNYHELESMVAFTTDIYDEIELYLKEDSANNEISGEFAHSLADDTANLVNKAINIMKGKIDQLDVNIAYKLIKNIPIGAGIGGGSSDAAAVIHALQQIFDIKLNENLIMDINLALGTDVPVCYYGKKCFVTGIGDNIKPIIKFPYNIYIVVINPFIQILTKDIFSYYLGNFSTAHHDLPTIFNSNIDLINFLKFKNNDLTNIVANLYPRIQELLNIIAIQPGAKLARMSGSGSSCFGLFFNIHEANQAARNINNFYPNYWVKISSLS